MTTQSTITLLIGETDQVEDGNYFWFANELLRRGFKVKLAPMDSLRLTDSQVSCQIRCLDQPLSMGEPLGPWHSASLENQDIVWVLALGIRHSFLDKIQLLYNLPPQIRVINSLDSLMHLKSKYFLASSEVIQYPASWASNDPQELYQTMQDQGGEWIVKPPAGSFGREVYRLNANDVNAHVILESMTDYDNQRYCLMQRYVPEISQGEKRVLFAHGEPVGQYLRIATRDHRTNLMQGGEAVKAELTSEESLYCQQIGRLLKEMGAEFVGMDLAYPWVIEFNVVNPGGLTTIQALENRDLTGAILDRLFP